VPANEEITKLDRQLTAIARVRTLAAALAAGQTRCPVCGALSLEWSERGAQVVIRCLQGCVRFIA
jgi:hypothetical protein